MTDEAALTLRLALFAGLVGLTVVIPNEAGGSRIRNALNIFVLAACFYSGCALLVEALADITLYAVPVSAVVIAALLFLVIEPKISTRLRAIFPDRRAVDVSVAWSVRVVGTYGAVAVYLFVMFQVPVAVFAAITLASGLLAFGGLLTALRHFGPPANSRERLRQKGGVILVALAMMMIFGGSFGVSLLFDFPYETGTRGIIMHILFGPVYALGLPVGLLGLWLLVTTRRLD